MKKISFITIASLAVLELLAASDGGRRAQAKGAAKAKPTGPTAVPLELRWELGPETSLRYDFHQRVEIKATVDQPQKPPIEIEGEIHITQKANSRDGLMTLDATRKDLLAAAAQSPGAAKAPTAAGPSRGVEPDVESASASPSPKQDSSTASQSRGFFSCSPPPAPAPKPVEPKTAAQAPPKKPTAEHGGDVNSARAKLLAHFDLNPDGQVKGDAAKAGGQTELMMRLLMPLPKQPVQVGEKVLSDVEVLPLGRRFPMVGKRQLTVQEVIDVNGQRCARIFATVEMRGEGHGAGQAAQQMKGQMSLQATTHGLFAIDAGYYREAQTELTFTLSTERMVDGAKQAVTLSQTQNSEIKLKADTGPKKARPQAK